MLRGFVVVVQLIIISWAMYLSRPAVHGSTSLSQIKRGGAC